MGIVRASRHGGGYRLPSRYVASVYRGDETLWAGEFAFRTAAVNALAREAMIRSGADTFVVRSVLRENGVYKDCDGLSYEINAK